MWILVPQDSSPLRLDAVDEVEADELIRVLAHDECFAISQRCPGEVAAEIAGSGGIELGRQPTVGLRGAYRVGSVLWPGGRVGSSSGHLKSEI